MSTSAAQSSSPDRVAADPALAELVERLTARLQAGESVDVEAISANYPGYADRLRQLLPALEVLADLGRSAGHEAAPSGPDPLAELGVLGDFRIVREVGRGGMGVVYEAGQLSLGRRVALKVLPFAAALDPRQLQRFQNEAQAAAGLHHTHIVPVFAVGGERGVHYYAMQFIEGRTLAEVIRELRPLDLREPPERATAGQGGLRAVRRPSCLRARRRPAGRSSRRSPGWASRRPRRWSTPTPSASSTATSSRPTCWSMPGASSGSPTSAWPGSRPRPG